jgi:hypothetical protein
MDVHIYIYEPIGKGCCLLSKKYRAANIKSDIKQVAAEVAGVVC